VEVREVVVSVAARFLKVVAKFLIPRKVISLVRKSRIIGVLVVKPRLRVIFL
jgi:hypothetical protein